MIAALEVAVIRKGFCAGFGVALLAAALPAAAQKMDLKELLARHAQSLKKSEAAALKSRALEGSVEMTVVVGGAGTLAGTASLLSDGEKRQLTMRFGHGSYDHERMVTDGEKIAVDMVNAARRSDLGVFLLTQDQIFKEGLLGGVLSSAWPLANGAPDKAKLKYEGLKKVDGRELHMVRYRTEKKSGDVEITMYFDANTFSHVRTTYLVTMGTGVVSTPGVNEQLPAPGGAGSGPGSGGVQTGETMNARRQTTRFRLDEEFDDFRNSEGYVIPAKWKIRYTMETQQSRVYEWLVTVTGVKNNVPIEAKSLEVK